MMELYQRRFPLVVTRHIGMHAVRVDNSVAAYHHHIKQRLDTLLVRAELSSAEQQVLYRADVKMQKYLAQKYQRLVGLRGMPFIFPECVYSGPLPGRPDIGAFIMPQVDQLFVCVDRSKSDLLNWAALTGHERSHQAAALRQHVYWENGTIVQTINMVGLESVGNRRKIAGGLENGLAYWDQADMYEEIKHDFPDQVEKRKKKIILFTTALREFARMGLGNVSFEEVEPFIHLGEDNVAVITMGFYLFKFAQAVCRKIGDGDMQKGRDMLDRARFFGTTQGLQAVVQMFGPQVAKEIFSVDQHGGNILEVVRKING